MVDELIRRQQYEIAEHEFTDWAHTSQSQPVTDTQDGRLTDRSVFHTARKQSTQVLRDLKSATIGRLNILSQNQHPAIVLHCRSKARVDSIDDAVLPFNLR